MYVNSTANYCTIKVHQRMLDGLRGCWSYIMVTLWLKRYMYAVLIYKYW